MAGILCGTPLQDLGRKAKDAPTAAVVAGLQSAQGDPEQVRWIALAAAARRTGDRALLVKAVNTARTQTPALVDYADFEAAWAAFDTKDYNATIQFAANITGQRLRSPMDAAALVLQIRSHLALKNVSQAQKLLNAAQNRLSAERFGMLSAQAADSAGDPVGAARYYARVFYGTPLSADADDAAQQLERLKRELGVRYPEPSLEQVITRAEVLRTHGQSRAAALELSGRIARATDADQPRLQLERAKAELAAGSAATALALASALQFEDASLEADRLLALHNASRKLERRAEAARYVADLNRFPHAPQRAEALFSLGNMYLLKEQMSQANEAYAACGQTFKGSETGALCHWKIVWATYLNGGQDRQAEARLVEHLNFYPRSDKAGAALFYLGRLLEGRGERQQAAAVYNLLEQRNPNNYYVLASRSLLTQYRQSAQDPAYVAAWKKQWAGSPLIDLSADGVARQRLSRARLLRQIGWDEEADQELRFGAANDPSKGALAVELISSMQRRGEVGSSVRLFKRYFPEYLRVRLDSAPEWFWKLGFPMPYREQIERYAKSNEVDPFVMAGLIRQESEFDPQALSRARAHGLTQVMPATGRQLAPRVGIKRFNASMLFQPDVNLRLGIFYFAQLTRSLEGMVEAALASYNGGKSRVDRWLQKGHRTPEEFVESIPLSETRTYVQAVLRNADIYRRLYGNSQESSRK